MLALLSLEELPESSPISGHMDSFRFNKFAVAFRCTLAMTERRRAQAGTDLVSWSCRTCKTTRSIRDRSFFSGSKLTLQQWMIAILWWSREYPVTEMALEASITEETACNIYQWLREVCSTKLLSAPIVLGGPGVIVQIDESLFKHKPCCSSFAKCSKSWNRQSLRHICRSYYRSAYTKH